MDYCTHNLGRSGSTSETKDTCLPVWPMLNVSIIPIRRFIMKNTLQEFMRFTLEHVVWGQKLLVMFGAIVKCSMMNNYHDVEYAFRIFSREMCLKTAQSEVNALCWCLHAPFSSSPHTLFCLGLSSQIFPLGPQDWCDQRLTFKSIERHPAKFQRVFIPCHRPPPQSYNSVLSFSFSKYFPMHNSKQIFRWNESVFLPQSACVLT